MTPVCMCKRLEVIRGKKDPYGHDVEPYCGKCGFWYSPKYGSHPEEKKP